MGERASDDRSIEGARSVPPHGRIVDRGVILDIFAFALNLAAMTGAANLFQSTVKRAANDDFASQKVLFVLGVAMFFLAPIGAVLGRWHYHSRRTADAVPIVEEPMGGCLFNPIFYFCLTAVVFSAINAFVLQTVYGKKEPDGAIFVGSVFLGLGLMIAHTVLVYRYFAPPKQPPRSRFMRSSSSRWLSDACIFANMTLFQQFWSLLAKVEAPRPQGILDLVLRVALISFLALLLYFPPRVFYLAEDIGKRWAWATILLANAPILARFVFGLGGN